MLPLTPNSQILDTSPSNSNLGSLKIVSLILFMLAESNTLLYSVQNFFFFIFYIYYNKIFTKNQFTNQYTHQVCHMGSRNHKLYPVYLMAYQQLFLCLIDLKRYKYNHFHHKRIHLGLHVFQEFLNQDQAVYAKNNMSISNLPNIKLPATKNQQVHIVLVM